MKANTMNSIPAFFVPLILGLVCVAIVYAALNGKTLPMISTPRAALIALLIIGMTMCAGGGIGQVSASGHWASPLAIVGYLLGAAILVVFVATFAEWKLPFIQDETQAVAAVAALLAVKYVLGTAGYFLHLL